MSESCNISSSRAFQAHMKHERKIDVKRTLRDQESELERLRSLVFKLNSNNAVLRSKLEALTQLNDSLAEELNECKRNPVIKSPNPSLEHKLQKEKQKNKALTDALKSLKQENKEQIKLVASKDDEIQTLRIRLSEVMSQKTELRVDNVQLPPPEFHADVSGIIDLINEQSTEIESLYTQRNALVKELGSLSALLEKEESIPPPLDYDLLPEDLKQKLNGCHPNEVVKSLVDRLQTNSPPTETIVKQDPNQEESDKLRRENEHLRMSLNERKAFIEKLLSRNCDEQSTLLMKCAKLKEFVDANAIPTQNLDIHSLLEKVNELTRDELVTLLRYLVDVNTVLTQREARPSTATSATQTRHLTEFPKREYDEIRKENKLLRARIRHIKRKYARERDAFCAMANKLASEIEQKMLDKTEDYEERINLLSDRLDMACRAVEKARRKARDMRERHIEEMNEKDLVISKLNQVIELNQVSLENQRLKLQVQEVDFEDERQEFADHFERVIAKKNQYKRRIVDNFVSEQAMNDLKSKARKDQESIISKYEACLKHIQSDRDNLKSLCQKIQDQLSRCMIEKQELTNDKCRAVSKIKALQIQLAEALKCRERERLDYETKLKGAAISQGSQIRDRK